MTGEEIQVNWFSTFHLIMYCVLIFITMVVYYKIKWKRLCENNVKVLVKRGDGGTDKFFAPTQGNFVSITQKSTGITRLWPINQLCFVRIEYPDGGMVPWFMRESINLAILNEEDYEPVLNNSAYTQGVISPDSRERYRELCELLRSITEDGGCPPEIAEKIHEYATIMDDYTSSLATAPTRKLIGSPALLGLIFVQKFTQMAAQISSDMYDRFSAVTKHLGSLPNSRIVYAGLAVIILLCVVSLFWAGTGGDAEFQQGVMDKLQKIETHLGVPVG